MSTDIHILLVLLLVAAIFAVVRLYVVLGQVRQSLTNLEETRVEVGETMKRLESVAHSTEEILRTEVTPTLQVTRATLANLEITTKALADTTLAVRGITGRAEQAVNVQRLLSAALPFAKGVTARGGGVASGLFAGISAGFKAVMNRKKGVAARKPELEASTPMPAITGGEPATPVLSPGTTSKSRRESRKQKQ